MNRKRIPLRYATRSITLLFFYLASSCLPHPIAPTISASPIGIPGTGRPSVAATAETPQVYLPVVERTPTIDPPIVTGNIFYVAPTGNDSNPGTAAQPWRTIQKGVSALEPGDGLYLRSGVYIQTRSLVINRSGESASKPITIATAPGEPSLAVITGDTNGDGVAEVPDSSGYSALVELTGRFIQLRDLEVAYSGSRGVESDGSNNQIIGNQIHHIWRSGIYVNGADNLVKGNSVWRTSDINYCNGVTGRMCNNGGDSGIAWGNPHDSTPPGSAPGIVVLGNKVFNTSGEGILCMHTDGGLIEGNTVYDNWALNIYLDQCSYTTIQENLVYYTDDPLWWKWTDRPGTGILLANEGITDQAGHMYPVGHDRLVINNILVGNGANFGFWHGSQPNSALVNDLIANNTMVNAQGAGGDNLKIDAGPHENTRFINNLVLQTSGSLAAVSTVSGLEFSHNLWSRTPPSNLLSSADVIADPLLIDPNHVRVPGEVVADWYRLQSDVSPAVDRGLNLSQVKVDFWTVWRDSSPDIGAEEVFPR